eukprot:scaffold246945_cov17-Prasinocladus_malaysianus.AAC.1
MLIDGRRETFRGGFEQTHPTRRQVGGTHCWARWRHLTCAVRKQDSHACPNGHLDDGRHVAREHVGHS